MGQQNKYVLLRYDRGDLEQSLDSTWGPGWESQYLKEQTSHEN